MSTQEKVKTNGITWNPTFAAILGAIAGAIAGVLLTLIVKDIQYHDVVTYNNVSSYIKSELVRPGLVSEEILEKDDPFQQIEMLAGVISEMNFQNEDLSSSIRKFLIAAGEKESNVSNYSTSQLLSALINTATIIQGLENDNALLLAEANRLQSELQSQVLVKLRTPNAYISGEQSDTTIKDYLALINSHNYYSEEFLNSFLPKSLVYEDDIIYYDKEAPERINVINSGVIYDNSGFNLCNGSSHFTMGLQDYNNGIRPNDDYRHFVYIACNKNYSQISFTLGHVDNTDRKDRELTIYYMDNEGNFKESTTISLYGDMPIQSYSIPIYNTRTVKIGMSDGWYGDYALADIYLVK